MKEDSTESTSTSSSFEPTVTPQAHGLPPIQQPPASLHLPFGADVQSVPGMTPNPAPLQLSTLNPGSAVAIPPIQQPIASLPLPFGADVPSIPGQILNLAANPAAVNTVDVTCRSTRKQDLFDSAHSCAISVILHASHATPCLAVLLHGFTQNIAKSNQHSVITQRTQTYRSRVLIVLTVLV
jgi:hypothetical protein